MISDTVVLVQSTFEVYYMSTRSSLFLLLPSVFISTLSHFLYGKNKYLMVGRIFKIFIYLKFVLSSFSTTLYVMYLKYIIEKKNGEKRLSVVRKHVNALPKGLL